MIEIIILNHLKNELSVPPYLESPENAPSEYVLFEKTGGNKNNLLKSSTFAFQSYSDTMYGASLLNAKTKEAVESLLTLDEIVSVKLNNDYNYTDTTTKKYRYQAVYDIKHY